MRLFIGYIGLDTANLQDNAHVAFMSTNQNSKHERLNVLNCKCSRSDKAF